MMMISSSGNKQMNKDNIYRKEKDAGGRMAKNIIRDEKLIAVEKPN
jgi:hypothetical protein